MTSVPSDLDLGTLLAEHDFVRRLVHSLVYHDADAEDVVQQTWLAALGQPLRRRASARAFLGQVARHVASNFRRGEVRRRRHEQAAVPAEPEAASVADAFARETLRQQVVAELAAIPEPYRGTLVLRYFEDVPPHLIARRGGLPDATVRARLKRGLDMLRDRLDRRFAGDRSAWRAALAPLARGGHPAAATAAAAGVLGLAKWLLIGGAAVLAATVFLAPGDRQPATTIVADAPAAGTPATAPASAASTTPAPARAALPAAAPPSVVAKDARVENGIAGRLVSESGEPRSGCKVELMGLDPTRLFDGDPAALLVGATTESDGDGRFRIADVRPRALCVLRAGRGDAHSACLPVPHTPGPGRVVDLGDIVLTARGTLRGRVADEDGNPVAGAEVWAGDVPGLITLAVNVDRFAPAHGGILLLPKRNQGEDLASFAARTKQYLGRDMFLRPQTLGDDFDASALDTPDWLSRLWTALPMARTTTAADGSFALADVEPGTNMVVVGGAGFDRWVKPAVKVAAGAPRDLGTITLSRGDTCTGSVVGSAGRAVAGAAVRVALLPAAGFRGLAFCEAEVRADAQGRFTVPGLRGGRVLVAARARDDDPWTVRGPFAVDAAFTLALPAAAELTVRVTSPAGAAPTVRLSHGPSLGELGRMGLRRAVALEGRVHAEPKVLRVRDLVPGSYLLEVDLPGHVTARELVQVPGEVDLALAPQAPAFDVVVVSSAGVPVAGARVRRVPLDPALARAVLATSFGLPLPEVLADSLGCTGADGRMRVTGLPSGPVTLWADHPAHGVAAARADLPVEAVVLRLPDAAAIEGTLLDNGQPARAAAWRIAVIPGDRDDGIERAYALAAPAADGSFAVTGLDPGPHTLRVLPALAPRFSLAAMQKMVADRIFSFFLDLDAARSREVVLRPGQVRTLELDVAIEPRPAAAQARVAGRVTVDGVAAAGIRVHRSVGTFRLDQPLATTAADGSYAIDDLAEGTLELSFVDARGYVLGSRSLALAERSAETLDFEVSTARLAGRVLAPPGRSLEAAEVSGQGPNGAFFTTPVATDGRFAAEALACGTWTLTLTGKEITGPATGESVVLARDRATPEVVLRPLAGFSVDVRVEGAKTEYVSLDHLGTTKHSWSHHVDKDGRARFSGLPAGRYRVSGHGTQLTGEAELGDKAHYAFLLNERGLVPID